jgi:site-specific recombinase XerC
MSRKVQAKHSVVVANNQLGGAKITKVQRKRICKQFIDWCFEENYPLNSLKDATSETVGGYIQYLKQQGVSIGTLHNRLASIRRAMAALGSKPDEVGITAKALGLPSRDRSGTKVPIPDATLEISIADARAMGEEGFALMLRLERLLGLRGLESLMSVLDLERYAIEARELLSAEISITRGTKGGRKRYTDVLHARASETLATIHSALVFARAHGGYLLAGAKPGLKSARSKYHRLARAVGLTGQYAPHSLRYAYATEKLIELRDAGMNRKEASSQVAKFLGHGITRDRYVSKVYGRTVIATIPTERRKARIDRAISVLEGLIR